MHNSESEPSIRRAAGIIYSKTGEKLGTIEEEHYGNNRIHNRQKTTTTTTRHSETEEEEEKTTPRKSATFHGLPQLHSCDSSNNTQFGSDHQLIPSVRRHSRKRSLFYEMGSRIRLFSTGSFVSTSAPVNKAPVPKTQSLNSFREDNAALIQPSSTTTTHTRPSRSRMASVRSIGSIEKRELSLDMELTRDSSPSQLGVLCRHCSIADLTCPKAQQEMASPSVPSLFSLAASDLSSNEALCRICHCCWPSDPTDFSDPLISPCRCSGSLQYVHVSCLMHWLDISSRKLHRPAICELCLYKYRRRRVLKYREIKFPECAEGDFCYYSLFISAIILMIFSALATIICFQLDKNYGSIALKNNTTTTVSPEDTSYVMGSDEPVKDVQNLLSTVTLVSAIVFFFSFFMAMYAHVKSGLSFCNYLVLCWSSNLDWSIEEYKQSRDSQYLSKLEELRRKINEKQKKAPDEIEPLRPSVVVIE